MGLVRSSASLPTVMTIGLVFEIVSSYAIAAAEFTDRGERHTAGLGLSWVAVWTLLFTVVVPTRPRRALMPHWPRSARCRS